MQQRSVCGGDPQAWSSGHSSPLKRQPRELPNADRTWVNHHERGVALKVQATWAGLSTTANHALCINLSQGSVKTLQPNFLWLEYSGSHWTEESEEWAWRGARRGREKPPLAVLRSRQAPRKTWFNCAMIRQPTLVVAWVGTCWHASAHKGCPVFPRRAPGLNTIAEADDRYCLVEATVVIRHHDLVEHKTGAKSHRREGSELNEFDRTARSESVLGRRWR